MVEEKIQGYIDKLFYEYDIITESDLVAYLQFDLEISYLAALLSVQKWKSRQ